jgi:cytochrome c oxidase cbb3-type subunit 3
MVKTFIFFLFSVAVLAACSDATTTNNSVRANASNTSNTSNTATVVNGNSSSNSSTDTTSQPGDALARGKQLYSSTCANCHKEDGTGGPKEIEGRKIKAENLVSDKMKNWTDDRFFKVIDEGIEDEGMPAFGDRLSDEEIRSVISYVRT